jgi:hypothetical protein
MYFLKKLIITINWLHLARIYVSLALVIMLGTLSCSRTGFGPPFDGGEPHTVLDDGAGQTNSDGNSLPQGDDSDEVGDAGTSGDEIADGSEDDNEASEEAGDPEPVVVNIQALFPLAGANWNDYVRGSLDAVLSAADEACDPANDSACFHAGEVRELVGLNHGTCDNLTIEDQLAAFEWQCIVAGPSMRIFSTSLKNDKRLADLVTESAWQPNSVRVYDQGVLIAESSPEIWWGNPVRSLPANNGDTVIVIDEVDDDGSGPDEVFEAGTILTLATSQSSAGYNLNLDKLALTTLDNAVLSYEGDGSDNCVEGLGEITPFANSICLVAAGGQTHLWVEGIFDADGPSVVNADIAVYLHAADFSIVRRATVRNSLDCNIYYRALTHARLVDSKAIDSDSHAIFFYGVMGSEVLRTHGQGGSRGLTLWMSDDNKIRGFSAVDNAGPGIALDPDSDRNFLVDIRLDNNGRGIDVSDCVGNIFSSIMVTNSEVRGFECNTCSDTTISNILIASNSYEGVYFLNGQRNTLAFATIVNNQYEGLRIENESDGRFVQLLIANNGRDGLASLANSGTCSFVRIVAAHNGEYGVHTTDSAGGLTFNDVLLVGNNATGDCWIEGVGNASLNAGSGACLASDTEPVVTSSVGLTTAFVGRVSSDSTNPSVALIDGSGTLEVTSINEWNRFDNRFRAWGVGQTSAAMDSVNRQQCVTGACAPWDWRLAGGTDAPVLNSGGTFNAGAACPATASGDTIVTDAQTTPNVFLLNARELLDDNQGDDDGLCEDNEACLFAPNIGVYQGEETNLSNPCIFFNGSVSGVEIVASSINGG